MHGRVSMLAVVGFLVHEKVHPVGFSDGAVLGQLDQLLSTETGVLNASILLMAIFFAEVWRTRVGWVDADAVVVRQLRPGYLPGKLGFDPAGVAPKLDEKGYLDMQNKELNNGRLAMIAIAGMVVQELVTKQALFA